MTWQHDLKSGFHLNANQIDSFETLLNLLSREADRNLTAVTGALKIVDIHFLDSLGLVLFPETLDAEKAVDIGSGAGFPGLPLAIALPGLSVTMIEARRKKCAFIEKAIDMLGLENANVLQMRAEDAGRTKFRDSFDLSFARAVGSLPEVLEYSLPLLKKGGTALLQRGGRKPGDVENSNQVAQQLGGVLDRIEPVSPYPQAKNLHVWVFSKVIATPNRYPRKSGIARKRPLGSF